MKNLTIKILLYFVEELGIDTLRDKKAPCYQEAFLK